VHTYVPHVLLYRPAVEIVCIWELDGLVLFGLLFWKAVATPNPFFVIQARFWSRLYLKRKRKQGDNFERSFFAPRLTSSTFSFIVFILFLFTSGLTFCWPCRGLRYKKLFLFDHSLQLIVVTGYFPMACSSWQL